jgi:membrane protease YdiL (CAAX protease family)
MQTAAQGSKRTKARDVVIAVALSFMLPWLIRLAFGLHAHEFSATGSVITATPTAVAVAVLATRWGWWQRSGWRAPDWRAMWLLWLPVAPVVALLVAVFAGGYYPPSSVSHVVAASIAALLVGFNEETWFRGLLLEGLRSRGVRFAVVVQAVIFGALHLLNYPAFGLSFSAVQALGAFGFGLVYGAGRVRIGAIWPFVLLHAVGDFPAILTGGRPAPPTAVDVLISLGTVGVAVVYALVLTRRSKISVEEFAEVGHPS